MLLVIMRRWNRSSPCYRKNVHNRHRWESRGQLRKAIVHWVERVYQRKRRQRRLAKLTPVEYELVHEKDVVLAVKNPGVNRTFSSPVGPFMACVTNRIRSSYQSCNRSPSRDKYRVIGI